MTESRFHLSQLSITGIGRKSAEVSFRPGLNVIAGASNTGKTYIFRAIDFMLGSSTPPEEIPESFGYTNCRLQFITGLGKTYTLSRALAGGNARLYEAGMDSITESTVSRELGAKMFKGDPDTIAAFLLQLSNLSKREVRRNEKGEKSSLSFRDVAHISLVDEERIITKGSPVLSGQRTDETKQKSVFGLFLTGSDDSDIIAQENTKDKTTRLNAELNLLKDLIVEREKLLLGKGITGNQIAQQKHKLEQSIQSTTASIATHQEEIDVIAKKRDQVWKRIQEKESRFYFLGDQLKRLRLLQTHYGSDYDRLESALEAGTTFEQLPGGACPVCGHKPDDKAESAASACLHKFQSSCQAEMKKIQTLSRDLDTSLTEILKEHTGIKKEITEAKTLLGETNDTIERMLQPKLESAGTKLSHLLEIQSQLAEATRLNTEIQELQVRSELISHTLNAKSRKVKLAPKVETRTAAQFCDVVAATLKAWKYPQLGAISFDPIRFDLVIGNQNRGSMGKGYRALTHAAFTVSLMRYSRLNNLPHPGFVIIDTPLNPFRGPDDKDSEFINQEVQNAFYSDLAQDSSGDQFLVLENTEPPQEIRSKIQYIHFTGAQNNGRYGYFPPIQK